MDDLISREAALSGIASIAKAKAKSSPQKAMMGRSMFFIERLPSVQPEQRTGTWKIVEVLHGEWEGTKKYACDKCGEKVGIFKSNYCPNCGAKMVKEESKHEQG